MLNRLLTNFALNLLALLLLVLLSATSASAGQWKFEGYFWSGSANSVQLSWQDHYGNGDGATTRTLTTKSIVRNQTSPPPNEDGSPYGVGLPNSIGVEVSGRPLLGGAKSTSQNGFPQGEGNANTSVYALFTWQRSSRTDYNELTGSWETVLDPEDTPPKHIYVREEASLHGSTHIRQADGNWTGYTVLKPWQGDYYEIKGGAMGIDLGQAARPKYDPVTTWEYQPEHKIVIRRVDVSNDQAIVPSRSFHGQIKLSPGYEKETFDQYATASLSFGYEADVLNFFLNASAPAVAGRKQKKSDTEEIDALVQLRWLHPDNLETGANGEDKIVPSRSQAAGFWSRVLGTNQIDGGAPIPYFAGQATFSVSATRSDGRTPIFDSQIYKWTPEDNHDPFEADNDGKPGYVSPSGNERTYVWNFGSASEGAGSFPKSSTVSVEVKLGNPKDTDDNSLKATKTINWYTTWSPTETGLQKNVVSSQFGRFVLPDGSPIAISDVKPGDTILCFVEGDPGFSTDSGHVEKIRPVPFENQVPGPGERIEPRVVGQALPTGSGDKVFVFNSTPKVNPDDDPNAPGFEDIRAAREVAAANQQAYQTGKSLTKTTLELQLEIYKAMSFGPAEGLAIEQAIKGVVAIGEFAEASRALKAITPTLEEGAEGTLLASKALRTAERDASIGAKRASEMEKVAVDVERQGARSSQLAKDAKGITNNGETYNPRALEKLRREGCFVAGTPVWMSDGTTKPIEQVKVGDTVLSKNEKTGEIVAKKVTNVSVRADIWTRKLTFDNSAVLETTDEHPLYVDGRGFVKAKEVGIGSSIVTRAGPSAKVVAVEADVRQATVYNFTVDEFHTYFVGDAALWVHNVDCSEFVRNLEVRRPVGDETAGFRQYQIAQAGENELRIGTGGNEIWADGLRVNASTNTVTALEAKFVGDIDRSPYIPGSNAPDFLRDRVLISLNDELTRYASAINDVNNPVKELEMITNNVDAAAYFRGLMQQHSIPGRVVVRP